MIIIIAGVVVAVVVCMGFFLLPKKEVAAPLDVETASVKEISISKTDGPLELIGVADTEEIAKKMAEDYDIELKSYEYGIAVFTTEKSFEEITEIGKAKGLPELSLNNEMKAY